MTFFVDANVIVYAAVDGEYHDACVELLTAIVDGCGRDARRPQSWKRSGTSSARVGWAASTVSQSGHYRILSPLLPVTDEAFARALVIDAPQLGTNDRVHVGTCAVHGISTIATADRGFDAARGAPARRPARRGELGADCSRTR